MKIVIELPDDLVLRLHEVAHQDGMSPAEIVRVGVETLVDVFMPTTRQAAYRNVEIERRYYRRRLH